MIKEEIVIKLASLNYQFNVMLDSIHDEDRVKKQAEILYDRYFDLYLEIMKG